MPEDYQQYLFRNLIKNLKKNTEGLSSKRSGSKRKLIYYVVPEQKLRARNQKEKMPENECCPFCVDAKRIVTHQGISRMLTRPLTFDGIEIDNHSEKTVLRPCLVGDLCRNLAIELDLDPCISATYGLLRYLRPVYGAEGERFLKTVSGDYSAGSEAYRLIDQIFRLNTTMSTVNFANNLMSDFNSVLGILIRTFADSIKLLFDFVECYRRKWISIDEVKKTQFFDSMPINFGDLRDEETLSKKMVDHLKSLSGVLVEEFKSCKHTCIELMRSEIKNKNLASIYIATTPERSISFFELNNQSITFFEHWLATIATITKKAKENEAYKKARRLAGNKLATLFRILINNNAKRRMAANLVGIPIDFGDTDDLKLVIDIMSLLKEEEVEAFL